MANRNIAFINSSTAVSDQEAIRVMNALQIQVTRDFEPVWGEGATLYFFSRNQQVPPGFWWLVITDDHATADASGYHDLTPERLPIGHIFARSLMQYNQPWSNTASHELLEMIEDPGNNLLARKEEEDGTFVLYSYEVCDACEGEQFGYDINGVSVSDFVLPAWFEDFAHPPGTRYDFTNFISEPFQLLPGGFIGVNREYSDSGWTMKYFDLNARAFKMRPYLGSRRERRRTPRSEWLVSTPNF
ncbi:MAG: hypothetical protein ACHQNT_12370 [Bacteroidia bacterium]